MRILLAIALLALAGCGDRYQPAGKLGELSVIQDKTTGKLYVVRYHQDDGQFHRDEVQQ